ncbi:sensor histidine kinase [Segatella maculosa]|uniref:sensor histidine kinase n=1 Tax=Segatella maculosa TaxID=439703 RepID=UPI00248FC36C|nr:histidine kinase [Segatella maculosa]
MGYNRTVEFEISQVFWKTGWFISFVLLTVAGIGLIIYRVRREQEEKRKRIRLKIASDLHDDVGSTLSSISIMSDLLQSRPDDNPNAEEMLRKIGSDARNLLDSMDDIIWSVNPQNDSFQNIIVRIREYAIPLFEPLDAKFSVVIPIGMMSLQLPMDIRRNLFLIAKEAINNAVKYSGCTEASIEFSYARSIVKMTVADNGKGFDVSKDHARNGLRNMRFRGEKIGGKVTIRSTIGKGTSVTLVVRVG